MIEVVSSTSIKPVLQDLAEGYVMEGCVLPPRLHGTSLPIQAPWPPGGGGEASLVDGEMRAEAPSKLVAPEAVSRAERDSD